MQQTNHVVLVKLEPQLILTLTEQELDELILADDQVLPLLLLIVDCHKIGHHELSQGPYLALLRQF